MEVYFIGDNKLKLNDFINITINNQQVSISNDIKEKIIHSRQVIDNFIENKEVRYGITTGFGVLKNKIIDSDKIVQLQHNLIRSHAVGIGEPSPIYVVRGMFLLRLTCICQGHSGIRLEVVNKLIEALNKNFIPLVPSQGTVGASGDLAPLSHLILGLLGEGLAYDFESRTYIDAKLMLDKLNMEPITLEAKEGLALNNGTQFCTSWTAFVTYHSIRIIKLSNFIASLTIEALRCTSKAFEPKIHELRGHSGQIKVAKEIFNYITENGEQSERGQKYSKHVQDAYSIRCIPQVHGPVQDIIERALETIEIEMNSVNDNPLIINNDIISGGNFHAQYIGMIADQLSYGMSLLCNISERRLERLINPDLNGFLPKFLIENSGLNSGLMIVQYCSAGITAENRHLANPASLDNIPTCHGLEDVVSMAGWSARKAMMSVENTYKVLSYELFTACQGLDFTTEKTTPILENIHSYIRQYVPFIKEDCYYKDYIDIINDILHKDDIFDLLKIE